MTTTYKITSDLAYVIPVEDGKGNFESELDAVQHIILHLESEKTEIVDRIKRAKLHMRQLRGRP